MNKLVVDLLQQKGLGCWRVLEKRCKQKGEVFPQLTNSMVLANLKSIHLVLNMFIFTRTLVTYARTIFKPRCCLNFKVCARKRNLLILRITCLDRSRWRYRGTLIGIRSILDGKPRVIGGQFVVYDKQEKETENKVRSSLEKKGESSMA